MSGAELCGSGVGAIPTPPDWHPPHGTPTSHTLPSPRGPSLPSSHLRRQQLAVASLGPGAGLLGMPFEVWADLGRLRSVAPGQGPFTPRTLTAPGQSPPSTWPDLGLFKPDESCWTPPDDSLRPWRSTKASRPRQGAARLGAPGTFAEGPQPSMALSLNLYQSSEHLSPYPLAH